MGEFRESMTLRVLLSKLKVISSGSQLWISLSSALQ